MKKNSFLMLLALVFLLSCRTDQFPEKEIYKNTSAFQLTSKRISLNESKHKTLLLPNLEKAETEIEKNKLNVQGKLTTIGNGITIDTDEVIYIENGPDFHSYTFKVIRDNAPDNAPVENVLMIPNTDGSYRVFHIILNLTDADKAKIVNKQFVDYKNKEQVTELASINLSSLSQKRICIPHYYSYPVSCTEGLHEPGEPCAYAGTWGAAYWGSIVLYDCFGEEPATIMPTPNPVDGGGGGGGECADCPDNTNPVQCVQVPTNPTQVGIVDPNGCIIGMPTEPYVIKSFNMIVRSLPADVKTLLNSNAEFYNGLQTYYNANQNLQGENFVKWAAQNVTWTQFKNWFMTKGEGQDGEYDEDSELVFSQQSFQQHPLPSMSQYELAFPSKPNPTYPDFYRDAEPNHVVYDSYVGGKLKQLFNQNGGATNKQNPFYNACAVRQSYAHNTLGIMIPFQHNDLKGANNWNYIMTASKMGIFLEKTYGQPTYKLVGVDANDPNKIKEFLEGKTGIYLLINNDPNQAGYTGHTDMIKNGYVSGGTAINLPAVPIKYIYIWELN